MRRTAEMSEAKSSRMARILTAKMAGERLKKMSPILMFLAIYAMAASALIHFPELPAMKKCLSLIFQRCSISIVSGGEYTACLAHSSGTTYADAYADFYA